MMKTLVFFNKNQVEEMGLVVLDVLIVENKRIYLIEVGCYVDNKVVKEMEKINHLHQTR